MRLHVNPCNHQLMHFGREMILKLYGYGNVEKGHAPPKFLFQISKSHVFATFHAVPVCDHYCMSENKTIPQYLNNCVQAIIVNWLLHD